MSHGVDRLPLNAYALCQTGIHVQCTDANAGCG